MRSGQNRKKLLIAITISVFAGLAMFNSINSQNAMINNLNSKLQEQDSVIKDLKKNASSGMDQGLDQQKSTGFVVAKKDLKSGDKLSSDVLEVKDLSKNPPSNGYNNINDLDNKFLSDNIKAGEPIVKSKILGSDFVNLDIPVGMRAITIPSDYIQGLASYVTVGSHIDVISTAKDKNNKSEVVLQNVKIISLEGVPAGGTIPATKATGVTLQIPAPYASKLVASMQQGKLQIISRNFLDNGVARNKHTSSHSYSYSIPRYYGSVARSHKRPNIKFELPTLPGNLGGLEVPKYNSLPSPAIPAIRTQSKKVEIIQANVKSEMSFDGN